MNPETVEHTSHTQETAVEKTKEQKLTDINEVYREANDEFYRTQEEDRAKIEEIKASIPAYIEDTPRRAHQDHATFVPVPKQASFWKKAAVFGTMAIAGLFSSKAAEGQQKNIDKEGIKKEFKLDTEEHGRDLSGKEKADWGEYVRYVKEKKLDHDTRMNTRAFANAVLDEFIASHPGTTVSHEQIVRIQDEFSRLRTWMLNKIKNKEKVNGHLIELADGVTEDRFMAHLSNHDGIAGPQTLREFPVEYEAMVKQDNVTFNDTEGHDMHLEYASIQKTHAAPKEFVSMREDGENK